MSDEQWLQLRPSYRAFAIPKEGIFLLSETDTQVLEGQVFVDLMPLLVTGARSDDLVDSLADVHPPERCFYALAVLKSRGVLAYEPSTSADRQRTFWDEFGFDVPLVERFTQTSVHVTTIGRSGDSYSGAIERSGFSVTSEFEQANVHVVVCDDYLQDEVAALARRSRSIGAAALLARDAGITPWIGPVFADGTCYDCLAWRLRTNNVVAPYVARRLGVELAAVRAPASTSVITSGLVGALLPVVLARWTSAPDEYEAEVLSLALPTFQFARHSVRRRPQCPTCGHPELMSRRLTRPIDLAAPPEGTDRADPEDMVSPIGGIVTNVAMANTGVDWLYSATAYFGFGGVPNDIHGLRSRLLSQASGVGHTESAARAGAVYEAVERYSGMAHGDEPTISARYVDLDPASVIDPASCMLYSDEQYRSRHLTNARQQQFDMVPAPFDPTAYLDWTGVWSLTQQRFRLLPTGYLFYSHRDDVGAQYCWADSNGCAAGSSFPDATVRGLYELIERDSVAIWWYNRLTRPQVDLASFDVPYFERFVAGYRAVGRDVWVLDLTTDMGVPSFAAVSRDVHGLSEDILVSFGAHLDAEQAILHALMEMNHLLPAVLPSNRDQLGDYPYPDPAQRHWWRTARAAEHGYLLPHPSSPPLERADYQAESDLNPQAELARLRQTLDEHGLELLVLDQSRPDIGVPVAKVIVPGLRHFWRRLAPGRLYEVPMSMGWLDRELDESELNPVAMFV